MAQAENHSTIAFANGTILLCAKIVDLSGTIITTENLSSIKYTIYSMGTYGNGTRIPVTGHNNASLMFSEVFYDTLQTEIFNGDTVTYNFKWTINNSVHECFPNPNENYLVRIDFYPASGYYISPIQVMVNTI